MNDPAAVIAALENAPSLIVPLVREVPPEVLKRRPAPGRWSAHEHACHLADVHALFFSRLEQFLAEERPRIEPFDPATQRPDGELLSVDLDDALRRFTEDRRRLVARLRELPAAAWQRTADHAEYSHYSLFIMFRHLALHDCLHAYRIEELLLKKDWELRKG
ncbi:MAG TPA: DinB family protein [Pyrinomonadaceae bacterium]|nr:DinB family protein [Pyrinomonadaceae bacterium]